MAASSVRTWQFAYDEVGVREDLERCRREDADAYARIIQTLEELLGSPSECEKFITEGWQDETIEDVDLVRSLQKERINGLRTKFWLIRYWRLLFVADHRGQQAALVAVMHRDQDYEKDRYLWDRIRNAIDRLGYGRY